MKQHSPASGSRCRMSYDGRKTQWGWVGSRPPMIDSSGFAPIRSICIICQRTTLAQGSKSKLCVVCQEGSYVA